MDGRGRAVGRGRGQTRRAGPAEVRQPEPAPVPQVAGEGANLEVLAAQVADLKVDEPQLPQGEELPEPIVVRVPSPDLADKGSRGRGGRGRRMAGGDTVVREPGRVIEEVVVPVPTPSPPPVREEEPEIFEQVVIEEVKVVPKPAAPQADVSVEDDEVRQEEVAARQIEVPVPQSVEADAATPGPSNVVVPVSSTSDQSASQAAKSAAGIAQLTSKGSEGFTAPTPVHLSTGLGLTPVIKPGEKGDKFPFTTNFIYVKIGEKKELVEYRLEFDPNTIIMAERKALLRQCQSIPEMRTFDGQTMYVSGPLEPKDKTELVHHPVTGEDVCVTFRHIKKMSLLDSVHFYNVLLRKINHLLGLVEMAKNFYDARITHQIPQHKLEICPGYATRIEETEGGLMLCLDASHRVLRTTSVLEIWESMKNGPQAQAKFIDYMVGQLVLTRYNNKCYRVDDVLFDKTPLSTFERGNEMVSFLDYYNEKYGSLIQNSRQPLLVSRPKQRKRDKEADANAVWLVPELCSLSGLTSEMTSNFTIMKDVAQHTRITPEQRAKSLLQYIANVNAHEKAKKLLQDWGLSFEPELLRVPGRVIAAPTIEFNPRCQLVNAKADFSREATTNTCYRPIVLKKYVVICAKNDRQKVDAAMKTFKQVCNPLGLTNTQNYEIVTTNGNYPKDYRAALQQYVDPETVQFVIVIMNFPRDDIYRAIKEFCVVDHAIPSQVLLMKNINNEKRMRSVLQKVALQINCKLGGAIWSLKIPLKAKIMFVGIDVYHDPKRKNPSVTALVASMDTECTRYYSRTIFQQPHQESSNSLMSVFVTAIEEFRMCNNGAAPDRVIVFRDGVSDGQMEITKKTEVVQLMNAFSAAKMERMPQFTFCVVQKRIQERFFLMKGKNYANPEPGSVLDSQICRKYFFDFFIVSQLVREGTVGPTHYIVLEDNSDIKPDLIQKFAFASTYMYFNWPGTIRVPAMCQYAHKLAYLAGQTLNLEPNQKHARNLFYL